MSNIQQKLQFMLEGTSGGHEVELDLKTETWCSCDHPSGFNFVKAEGGEQIWRHTVCGGLVVRPYHNRQDYGKSNTFF